MAYAMVSTDRPKASDTPSRPMPTCGKAAAITALPHPARTSQKVPMNSTDKRLVSDGVVMTAPNGSGTGAAATDRIGPGEGGA